MNRILITGSSGFVGQHLLGRLSDEGHTFFAPSHKDLDFLNPVKKNIHKYYNSDYQLNEAGIIADYLADYEIDTIIHLAATVAGLPGNIGNQGLFMYENLRMALNIFEASRLSDVKKIINLGSVCGYHDIGPKPFKEENFWLGLPHESNRGYGMAKRASIMLGIEYERQYGMNVTNLIPINLVGEYDNSNHVVMDLIRKFEKPSFRPVRDWSNIPKEQWLCDGGIIKEVQLWGSGSATRELLYVGDLVDAIIKSLDINTGAWPINIGTGIEYSIKEIAEAIKKIGNYNVDIRWDSSKPEGQHSRCLDIFKARSILNWEPKTTLDEALKKTIEWYRSNK